jgi:hypothetical protein
LAFDIAACYVEQPLPLLLLSAWVLAGLAWLLHRILRVRCFRFGLRDAAIFVAIVAAGLAIWENGDPFRRERMLISHLTSIDCDYETVVDVSRWLRRYYGDNHAVRLSQISDDRFRVTDEDLAYIHDLPKLQELRLSRTTVSDVGVANLRNLPSLHSLHLDGTAITDEGLRCLGELTSLKRISLARTQVTIDGLTYLLSRLPNVSHLDIRETAVTDDDLKRIAVFRNLRELNLIGCSVSHEGLRSFKGTKVLVHVDQSLLKRTCSACGLPAFGSMMSGYKWHVNPCQRCGQAFEQHLAFD